MLVADRGARARDRLASALVRAGFVVCASCGTAAEALRMTAAKHPDVCVVGLDVPGGGLTTVRALAAGRDPPRILVTASTARAGDLFAALRAGADGFVVDAVGPAGVAAEVAALAAGGAALSRAFTACLVAEFRRQADTSRRKEGTRCTDP